MRVTSNSANDSYNYNARLRPEDHVTPVVHILRRGRWIQTNFDIHENWDSFSIPRGTFSIIRDFGKNIELPHEINLKKKTP